MDTIRVKLTRRLLEQVIGSFDESRLPLADIEISADRTSGETRIRNITTGDEFAQKVTSHEAGDDDEEGWKPLSGAFKSI
ncbi:MAG: hypothetical protein ACM3XN_00615 [Chloroflexota bacterium]